MLENYYIGAFICLVVGFGFIKLANFCSNDDYFYKCYPYSSDCKCRRKEQCYKKYGIHPGEKCPLNKRNEIFSNFFFLIGVLLNYSLWPAITIYCGYEGIMENSYFDAIFFIVVTVGIVMSRKEKICEFCNNEALMKIIAFLVFFIGIISYVFLVSKFDAKWEAMIKAEEEYNSKIVTTMENEVIISEETRGPLTYFCNIPVQNVSGSVSGSSSLFGGSVNGSISTMDNLVYWYLKGEEGVCDSAPAKSSKMIPLQEGEMPYLKIITYCNREKTVNGNTGEVSYRVTKEWTEYEFYLPKEVVEGQFNN